MSLSPDHNDPPPPYRLSESDDRAHGGDRKEVHSHSLLDLEAGPSAAAAAPVAAPVAAAVPSPAHVTDAPPVVAPPTASAASDRSSINSHGYTAADPMFASRFSTRKGCSAADPRYQQGCCCSETGGCCFSDHDGCCFSSNDGCCFSDHDGCCFSDHDGCCFSDRGGCCFSSNGGSCCSSGR